MDSQLAVSTSVAVVVGVVVGYVAAKLLAAYTKLETDFALNPVNGDAIPTSPSLLVVKRKALVTWHITNTCSFAASVSLRNFALETPQGESDDLNNYITPRPPLELTIPANTKLDLTATIDKLHGSWTKHYLYKYEIWTKVGANAFALKLDPEIEMYDKN